MLYSFAPVSLCDADDDSMLKIDRLRDVLSSVG